MKLKGITIYALALICTLFIVIDAVSSDASDSFNWSLDPQSIVAKGTTFVSRLLCLLSLATPPIVLAFIVIGGVYYLGSADDPAKRKVAKNIVINGIIGGVCVMMLIAIASYLGIPVDCGGGGGGVPPAYSPYLIQPPDSITLTSLMLIVSVS